MSRGIRLISRSKKRLTLAGVLVVALASSLTAIAYWTTSGTGTGAASTGTLTAPGQPSRTNSGATVDLTWTASAVSGGGTIGYHVERSTDPVTTWSDACGTTVLSPTTSTSCTDSPSAGTYRYRVTAIFVTWTAESPVSNAFAVAASDTTPPTSTITFPTASAYNTSGWNSGCSTPGTGDICGTATDPGVSPSGVATVQVSIQRSSDSFYWNGTTWVTGPVVWNTATGTATWNYALAVGNLTNGLTYTVQSRATDVATNVQTTPDSKTFTYDTTAPTLSSLNRAGAGATVNSGPLTWTATFSEPVSGLTTSNFALATSGTGGTAPTITSAIASGGAPSATWTVSVSTTGTTGTNAGSIGLNLANATGVQDVATNNLATSTFTGQTYTFDTTAPTITVNQAAGQADPPSALPIDFTATFSEAVSGFDASDLTRGGTATGGTVAVTGGPTVYTIRVTNPGVDLTSGTISFTVAANKAQDAAGNDNTASTSTDNTVTYDGAAPTVTLTTPADGSSTSDTTPTLSGAAGNAAGDSTTVTVKIYNGTGTGGTVNQTLTPTRTGATWTTTATTLAQGTYTAQATQTDTAGNTGTTSANTFTVDTTAPTVTGVSSTLANGSYTVGQVVPVTVTFSEPVTVTGTPQLTLTTGSPATTAVNYTSGGGTSTLTFNYTVAAGNTSVDLNYAATTSLALNGGTIRDAATNNATLTLPALAAAGSLGTNKNIVIDTTAPTVTGVTSPLANGSYTVGQVVPVTVAFSEPVTVTGTPQLTLAVTPNRAIDYTSGTGTTTLTFNYTVQAGDTSGDLDYAATTSLALNGGTIQDAATNDATRTLAAPGAANSLGANKAIVVDTTAPTVTSVTSTLANGSYKLGQVVPVTVTFSEVVNVVGTPTLTLETGATDRVVNYTSGSGTATLAFNYTVQAGDTSADLDYVATNSLTAGTSIRDAALNDADRTLASPGSAGSLGANKALVIDTTAPTVTNVTSTLANGTYKAGQVVPVTVTFSESVTVTGTPQLTLSTGSPATTAVNYTSGTGTATLTFNYTVAAGNTSADLDYAATTSLTLNGGTIRDAALNDADRTLESPGAAGSLGANKAIVIDAVAPTVTNVTSTLADGSYKLGQVVPVTVTFSEPVTVTGTPQLTLTTGSPAATAVNYTSGSGTATLTFNYTVAAGNTSADLNYAATTSLALNGGTIQDAATNTATLTLPGLAAAGSLATNKAIVIDTTGPTVTNVTSTLANDSYKAGQVVPVTVTFGEPVTVTGTPQLTLSTGSPATTAVDYSSGSGTATLTFNYTVAAGNTSADLNYAATTSLALNGGTIQDAATNTATLTLPGLAAAGSLATNKNIVIDSTAPTLTSVQAVDDNSLGQITKSNGSHQDKLLFTYSENIDSASITTGNVSVIFTNNDATCAGSADSITVPGIGKVCLGSQAWLTATSTQTEGVSPSGSVVTVQINNDPTGNATGVAASNFTWSAAGGTATDLAGNLATGSVTTNTQRF